VHINARFRKPLEPAPLAGPEPWQPLWDELVRRGPPRIFAPSASPSAEALDEVAERAARAERGLIVCGPSPFDREGRLARAIERLARATGFVLLAETTSQARFGARSPDVAACPAFDSVLRTPSFRGKHAPDLILEIGAPPTSQGYADLIASHPGVARYVFAASSFSDPYGTATALVHGDPALGAEGIADRLPGARRPGAWAASFVQANERASAIAARLAAGPELTEAAVARAVIQACPAGSVLMIGNSNPVRDVDVWAPARPAPLAVLHQRGASGIDGLVSGAAGALHAAVRPLTLFTGDLSLLHDLGGLVLARRATQPLVIVVVQNGGGRIFEHLPVFRSADPGDFEKYFAMPEPIGFAGAAASFGLRYACANSVPSLSSALRDAYDCPGATLIEAVVPPGDGAERVRTLRAELDAELALEAVAI